MNRRFIISGFLGLGLAFLPVRGWGEVPASASDAKGLPIKSGQRVVFLGDSTTQGAWASASGFIHLVALGLDRQNVTIKPGQFGAQGAHSRDLLDLYQKKVAAMSPKADWLLVSGGLDEAINGAAKSDLAAFQGNMKSLVEQAKADGLQVMILTTSIANERGDAIDQKLVPYNEALRELAKTENCLLADVNAAEKAALPAQPLAQGNQRLLLRESSLNTHGERVVASEILKTFGVGASPLAEIQESWLDAPGSAVAAPLLTRLNGTAAITLREFNTLETWAAKEHRPSQAQLDAMYAASVIEALREGDAASTPATISQTAQTLFARDVAELLKTAATSAPATASPAVASPVAATDNILVKSGQKIAFLGDSITQFGFQHPYGYVNLVVRGLATVGVKVAAIPAGVSGNTSRDMLARLQRSVLDQKPDWLTLSCGVNDVWHGLAGCDLETYQKNITSIVDQAQQANIQVVILTATRIQESDNTFNEKLAVYNDFLCGLARERKFPLADLNEAELQALKAIPKDSPYKHLTVDGVHMNPHGDQMMALGVLKAFGLTDAQLAQVREHWLDEPSGASLDVGVALAGSARITLRESDALEQQAITGKKLLTEYLAPLYLQALIEQAKLGTTKTDLTALQKAAQDGFAQKIADLLKNPPAP